MKKMLLLSVVAFLTITFNVNAAEPAAKAEAKPAINVAVNELKGLVLDKKTNESLAGATITANGQKIYTDLDGNFVIPNVCAGKCTLKISMISYEDQTIEVNTNETNSLRVQLSQR